MTENTTNRRAGRTVEGLAVRVGVRSSQMPDQTTTAARDLAVAELAELDADPAAPAPVRARRQPTDPSQVYSVRMPAYQLGHLRRLADERGETPSALLRRWALERIEAELQAGEQARSQPKVAASLEELQQAVEAAVERVLVRRDQSAVS